MSATLLSAPPPVLLPSCLRRLSEVTRAPHRYPDRALRERVVSARPAAVAAVAAVAEDQRPTWPASRGGTEEISRNGPDGRNSRCSADRGAPADRARRGRPRRLDAEPDGRDIPGQRECGLVAGGRRERDQRAAV